MLQFLYVTDLHGWTEAYESVLDYASRHGIEAIVNGGDMLPKGKSLEASLAKSSPDQGPPPIFKIQETFIEDYLPTYFDRCRRHGLRYLAMFGNDDLGCHWHSWRELLERYDNVDELSVCWHPLPDGIFIRGCPHVPDVPFRLKDWALKDTRDFASPAQLAQPVTSYSHGLQVIDDLAHFLNSRPTLEETLQKMASELEGLGNMRRAILVGHSPPACTGLAVIHDGTDVGSVATTNWIEKHQPLLTLHGHIHESPVVSGVATAHLGRTICHNPGQFPPEKVAVGVITIEEQQVHIEPLLLSASG